MMNSHQDSKLKKEVGLLGSFSLGFADVGAGIFLALGLIAAYAGGVTPLAILGAAFVYLLTGFSYAELSSYIPISGGASVFGERAFGRFIGFLGGWGLILDYTICISIFAVASAGYLSFFFPEIRSMFPLVSSILIAFLTIINLVGIKESSKVNSILTLGTILLIVILAIVGFSQFDYQKFSAGLTPIEVKPGLHDFLYSLTIAMVAFIGIESISQGAEETKHPERTLPMATILAVITVILSAIIMSVISLGVVSPEILSENVESSLISFAQNLPFANIIVPTVALAGFAICLVSSNTGIIGVSRVTYSMSNLNLVTRKFKWLHPRFCTPWVPTIIFSIIAMILVFFGDLFFLGELYAFGALSAYLIANISVVKLRFVDPNTKRPFTIPLNLKFSKYSVPIPSVLGFIGCLFMLILMSFLHEEGRNVALLWFVLGAVGYFAYGYYRKNIVKC